MASWTLVGSNAVTFADGNTGHVYTIPSGAPSAGQLDVLCVNSNTTVSTPASAGGASWTLGPSSIHSQGAYIWYRIATGGEPGTITVTTAGNFATDLSWSRWSAGTITADVNASAFQDASSGTTTPPVTTPGLAQAGELSVAFGALHSMAGGNVSAPVWSAGYTAMTGPDQSGTTANDVAAWTGYNASAGPAAESPNVSWSTSCTDRYILVQTFKSVSSSVIGDDDVPWHIRSRR
jgi:hypothetical protein